MIISLWLDRTIRQSPSQFCKRTDTDTVAITIIGAPTADAGQDQKVHRLQNVTLNGSASSDPDGDTITYQWNQTAGPAITLSNNTAMSPTFTSPDSVATITFELTASDGMYSDTDTVTISVVNRPSWADAGPDLTVQSGEHITLSGTASTDADGDKLTHSWSVVTGQSVELTGHNNTQVSFAAPTGPTILGVLLTVSDDWHSSQDLVVIDVLKPPNRPPVSDAGTDQTIGYGKTVTLDGLSSTDPDNDDISYLWNQTHGVRVTLSDDGVPSPTFTSPNSTDTLQFDLIVSDGTLHSTDTVTISIINNPPVSDAGADRTVGYGKTITLDGSSSDTDNDTLHHTWQQLSGPTVSIHDSTTLSPSFVMPTNASALTFEITTSDGYDTSTDTVTISVMNNPPVSNAGTDQTVQLGSTATLDGSASRDQDGDTISYTWNQTAGTAVTLSDYTISNPTFTAPNSAGTWTFELTISDGYDTSTDTVTITVLNRPPVSDAGADLTVRFGDTVTLDGSASTDPDQDDISYVWKETTGTGVKLSDVTAQSPTFTAPNNDAAITFELTVSDGVLSNTDTVTITVKHPNRAPTADAGLDQTAKVGDKITLSGAASTDPDGDTLTYEWSVIIGPTNILSDASGSSVTVTIPKGKSLLGIYLIVSDGEFTSQDLVVITVR